MTRNDYRELFQARAGNNPQAWDHVGDLCERCAQALNGEALFHTQAITDIGAHIGGVIYALIWTTKTENIELRFNQLIEGTPGRTYGGRVLNWVMLHAGVEFPKDVEYTFRAIRHMIAHSIDMMILKLDPVGGAVVTPEQATEWIKNHGGIGQLHKEWMNRLDPIKEAAKEAEADRKAGAELRKQQAAQAAGFDSVAEYEMHLAKVAQDQRDADLRSKFAALIERLVANGTETTIPPDGRLVVAYKGRLYVLSEQDEFDLLKCAASVQ